MKKSLLIILPVFAFIIGAFGGAVLRGLHTPALPLAEEQSDASDTPNGIQSSSNRDGFSHPPQSNPVWLRFPTQFFVPLMQGGQVSGTMILSIIIETPEPSREYVKKQEHRLRDAMLRTLMIHANTGGFNGNFTTEFRMEKLRTTLLKTAQQVAGNEVANVLIEDIMRQ